MKTVKLETVLTHRSEKIKIDDLTNYKLVRIRLHRKGVMLRHMKRGGEIRTKTQQLCKHGDFIVAEMDAKVGGYGFIPESLDGAIVSSHYYLYEIDEDKLLPAFLNAVCQAGILQDQIVAKGSTNYSSVRAYTVLDWSIPLPPLDKQREIASQFDKAELAHGKLCNQITHQKNLLTKLKQATLQEAIEGKQTADWRANNPDVEPASELLKRIQAEKAQLIADKKIRKEKPLPEITPEETPFEIPDGWEWCRLGDLNIDYSGGATYKSTEVLDTGNNQVIRIGNIKPDKIDLSKRPAFLSNSLANKTFSNELFIGDFLFTMTGTYQKKDYCFSVLLKADHFQGRRLYQNQRVGRFRIYNSISKAFVIKALKLGSLLAPVFESSTGAANQANISKGALMSIIIPLPPLAEQTTIVSRVEALMATCRDLETAIDNSRTHAADLLQAVLKEAFSTTT